MINGRNRLAKTLAGMGLLAYVVCHFWQYVIPESIRPLHEDLLRISVLGWSGMNLTSFLLGAVQWALWGCLAGYAYTALGKSCSKCREERPAARPEPPKAAS